MSRNVKTHTGKNTLISDISRLNPNLKFRLENSYVDQIIGNIPIEQLIVPEGFHKDTIPKSQNWFCDINDSLDTWEPNRWTTSICYIYRKSEP